MFYESYYKMCLHQYDELKEERENVGKDFKDIDLQQNLSDLGWTLDGKMGFLTLTCKSENLKNLDGINNLSTQFIDLSGNQIQCLDPLFSMKNILKLNLSGNKLKEFPKKLTKGKLVELDVSNN